MLIHEATFEDALEAEALAKRHSLTREAVEAGSRAGCFRTLLTHFSQRYPKVPVVADIYCGRTARIRIPPRTPPPSRIRRVKQRRLGR